VRAISDVCFMPNPMSGRRASVATVRRTFLGRDGNRRRPWGPYLLGSHMQGRIAVHGHLSERCFGRCDRRARSSGAWKPFATHEAPLLRLRRTTGMGAHPGAKMSWPAPSGLVVRSGNRHRPGRTGIRLPKSSHEVREQNRGKYRDTTTGSIRCVSKTHRTVTDRPVSARNDFWTRSIGGCDPIPITSRCWYRGAVRADA